MSTYFEMWFQMKGHILGRGFEEGGGWGPLRGAPGGPGGPRTPGRPLKPGKSPGKGGAGPSLSPGLRPSMVLSPPPPSSFMCPKEILISDNYVLCEFFTKMSETFLSQLVLMFPEGLKVHRQIPTSFVPTVRLGTIVQTRPDPGAATVAQLLTRP